MSAPHSPPAAPDDATPPDIPAWKTSAFRVLTSVTPLRFQPVREQAFRAQGAAHRARRKRRERRDDRSLSQPALWEMDVRLGELLGEGGYFIEAGANDGYLQSNTYWLERFLGWRGVLVEPLPALAAEARRNRPAATVVQAALTDPEHAGATVRMKDAGLMSVVAGARGSDEADLAWTASAYSRGAAQVRELEVPGRTLSDILDEVGAPPEITLLSLDLEGFEVPALRGLDLTRHAPQWVLIEAHDEEATAAISATLGERYVRVERFSPWDELYRRADVSPAAAAR